MKNIPVKVKYQYFRVVGMDGDNDIAYDLKNWINRVWFDITTRKEQLKMVNGIQGRIEEVIKFENDPFYALNFMRVNTNSNTYKVTEEDVAEHIDLEDDEYLGKNTVALYDDEKHVLMVQINRGSYSVSAIESYINEFNDIGEECYLRPIHNPYNGNLKDNEKVKKLVVRFSDLFEMKTKSKYLEKVLSGFRMAKCTTAYVEIGMGRTVGEGMDKETITNVLPDLYDNQGVISTAKIVLDDDGKSVIYDLFNNIHNEFIDFKVPERGELKFRDMAKKMKERYKESGSKKINKI